MKLATIEIVGLSDMKNLSNIKLGTKAGKLFLV